MSRIPLYVTKQRDRAAAEIRQNDFSFAAERYTSLETLLSGMTRHEVLRQYADSKTLGSFQDMVAKRVQQLFEEAKHEIVNNSPNSPDFPEVSKLSGYMEIGLSRSANQAFLEKCTGSSAEQLREMLMKLAGKQLQRLSGYFASEPPCPTTLLLLWCYANPSGRQC